MLLISLGHRKAQLGGPGVPSARTIVSQCHVSVASNDHVSVVPGSPLVLSILISSCMQNIALNSTEVR